MIEIITESSFWAFYTNKPSDEIRVTLNKTGKEIIVVMSRIFHLSQDLIFISNLYSGKLKSALSFLKTVIRRKRNGIHEKVEKKQGIIFFLI